MTLEDAYAQRHPASLELYQRASKRFPGGVTHDNRFLRPFPIAFERGQGSRKVDVDGLEYIDYMMGHGALLLGHCHPALTAAVRDQVGRGTHLGGNTPLELEWAELICELIPSVERVRFHSSGTEASLMSMRLARAFTERPKIVRFAGHFHGWHDTALATPTNAAPVVAARGITAGVTDDVIVLPIAEEAQLEQVLQRRDVAAAIIEPTGASMGRAPLAPDFVARLRSLTEQTETLLILDEVVTGFRITPGGAQRRLGIVPDLTTMAKVLAGGLPGGAVGGRQEIMDLMSFDAVAGRGGRVGHPGTFNANPLSAAAGIATLRLVRDEPINDAAAGAATRLCDGLRPIVERAGAGVVYRDASLVYVALGVDGEASTEFLQSNGDALLQAKSSPAAVAVRLALLNEGVDAMAGPAFIVSAVHSDADIDETVAAVGRALLAAGLTD